MTLAWKRTLSEWARFSKAVISGETGRERENLSERTCPTLVRGQASLVTMLPCSPYSSDVCKGQQGTKEIRFGTNRSRCFLKHSNMRRDSDCQRYWVYLRTSAYLPLREASVNILNAGLYRWDKYNGIILCNATRQKTPNFRFFLRPFLPARRFLSISVCVILGPVSVQAEGSGSFATRQLHKYIHKSKYRCIYRNN